MRLYDTDFSLFIIFVMTFGKVKLLNVLFCTPESHMIYAHVHKPISLFNQLIIKHPISAL